MRRIEKGEASGESGEKNELEPLLEKLQWIKNPRNPYWGAERAAIIRARERGETLEDIGKILGLTHERVRQMEVSAREALQTLAQGKEIVIKGQSKWKSEILSWSEDIQHFEELIEKLQWIKAPWAPGWGAQAAAVLRALVRKESPEEIAEKLGMRHRLSIYPLIKQALWALEELDQGRSPTPPKRGRSEGESPEVKIRKRKTPEPIAEVVEMVGGQEEFLKYAKELKNWAEIKNSILVGLTYRDSEWGEVRARILAERLRGLSYKKVGEVIGKSVNMRTLRLWEHEALRVIRLLFARQDPGSEYFYRATSHLYDEKYRVSRDLEKAGGTPPYMGPDLSIGF